MGSETGAKWLIMLLLYFTIMTVIVTLVSDIAPTPITTSGGYDLTTNTSGTYCSSPRTIYELDVNDANEWFVSIQESNDYSDPSSIRDNNDWMGNINCEYSKGQLGESICNSLEGCSWGASFDWWFITIGDESCRGNMNYSWINESDIFPFGSSLYGFELVKWYDTTTGDSIYDMCSYPPVVNNQTRCDIMSCSWGDNVRDIDFFEADDIQTNLGMLGKIWNTVKEMVTFNFNFGFDNSTGNFILNFLIFYLPLIGLGLAIYVLVRS